MLYLAWLFSLSCYKYWHKIWSSLLSPTYTLSLGGNLTVTANWGKGSSATATIKTARLATAATVVYLTYSFLRFIYPKYNFFLRLFGLKADSFGFINCLTHLFSHREPKRNFIMIFTCLHFHSVSGFHSCLLDAFKTETTNSCDICKVPDQSRGVHLYTGLKAKSAIIK